MVSVNWGKFLGIMSSVKKPGFIKKTLKYLFIFIVSIMLLVNGFFWLLRFSTGFQSTVMQVALGFLNDNFQGEIKFDSFSGNLFNEFTLHDVRLFDTHGESLVHVLMRLL